MTYPITRRFMAINKLECSWKWVLPHTQRPPNSEPCHLVGDVAGSLHWIMIFHICTWQPVPIEIHILFRSVYYRIRIPNIRPRPLIVQWFMWAICYGVVLLPGKHAKYHYNSSNSSPWKSMVWRWCPLVGLGSKCLCFVKSGRKFDNTQC